MCFPRNSASEERREARSQRRKTKNEREEARKMKRRFDYDSGMNIAKLECKMTVKVAKSLREDLSHNQKKAE